MFTSCPKCNIRLGPSQEFLSNWQKKVFQTLEKKTDESTDMRDFGEFQSLSLECSSVVAAIQFVCSLYQENKATSNINELRHETFAKKNVSEGRLPPTFSRRVNCQTFV